MNEIKDPVHNPTVRTNTQMICIAIGVVFIFFGLVGILYPEMAGGHFSVVMNFIHIISGGLALASGLASNEKIAYYFSIVGFVFMFTISFSGFVFGVAGIPSVGFQGQEKFLLKIIPQYIELGIVDHFINLFLAIAFAFSIKSYMKNI